uniref:NADH-ubiquinone oxidoreductase chain 3 n=1 Tax=Evacanthus acuminatus TaxID=139555 RepID=A0A6N0A1F6_9HEMI|nr:NADH dehydrogenase subunit 3 [Evacanthus bivittatus]QKO00204.1 NADH dehydrogenase subunit 3 [Evacanthus acuminatus]WGC90086.1 NADH dehydrogenase subunit 3 [Evacanthus bivittatus]
MNLVLINFSIVFILIMLIMTLLTFLSKKSIIDLQKSTSFECGFNPMSYSRLPFSIHFFLIAVIFLIFDIEIIIIIPMIFLLKSSNLIYWLVTSVTFIIVLIIGLYHEWYNGLLNWTN